MSIKKVSKIQPELFEFTNENLTIVEKEIKKYPKGKKASAVLALLYLAQNQNNNWIPLAAIKCIAKLLDMPYINVYEVVTFYSMFNLSPVGKYFIQVCTTSPCLLRGANDLVKACQNKISKKQETLSENGLCSWVEVECLGACVNAPMMQVNKDYYEDLNKHDMEKILESFIQDKPLKPGSYRGRSSSAPEVKENKTNGINNA